MDWASCRSVSRMSTTPFFDVMDESEHETKWCLKACVQTRANAQTLLSMVLVLGAAGACMVHHGALGVPVPTASFIFASWLGCFASRSDQFGLCRLSVVAGALLLSLGPAVCRVWACRGGSSSGSVCDGIAWAGLGLCVLTPIHFVFCLAPAEIRGLFAGFAGTSLFGGYSLGRLFDRAAAGGPSRIRTELLLVSVQLLGVFLLQPRAVGGSQKARKTVTSLVRTVLAARESQFWALVSVAVLLIAQWQYLLLWDEEQDTFYSAVSSVSLVAAPVLWGAFGFLLKWSDRRTLRLLSVAVALSTALLPSNLGRLFLCHFVPALAAMEVGAAVSCFGTHGWHFAMVSATAVAALIVSCANRLGVPAESAVAFVAPAVVAICFSSPTHSTPLPSWVQGYRHAGSVLGGDALSTLPDPLAEERLQLVVDPGLAPSIDPSLVNCILDELWPYLRAFLEQDILKGMVEPILQREVSAGLRFDALSLGIVPPRAHVIWKMPATSQTDAITLGMDVEFPGDTLNVALKFAFGPLPEIKVNITKFAIRGTMFLSFQHPLRHLPLMQGVSIFFPNPLDVDIELNSFSGATGLLPEKVFGQINSVVNNAMTQVLVLPNRVSLPFTSLLPVSWLTHPKPQGLLFCDILGVRSTTSSRVLTSNALYCRLQLGAQVWDSTPAACNGMSTSWHESAMFFVDERAGQQLLISLNEKHRLGDERLSRLSIPITDLLWRRMAETPAWVFPSLNSSELDLSAKWHELSKADAFDSLLGAVLLVDVEQLKNVSTTLEGEQLMVRAFLVPCHQRPGNNDVPIAETSPVCVSRVTPTQQSASTLRELRKVFVDKMEMEASQGVDGERSEGDADDDDQDQWADRIKYVWNNLRTASGQHFREWASQDRDACMQTLMELLGAGLEDEPHFARFMDGACKLRRLRSVLPKRPRRSSSMQRATPAYKREPECHWHKQFRFIVLDTSQDLWLEVVKRSAPPVVLGAWRRPLLEMLQSPGMVDPLCGHPLELMDTQHSAPLTLLFQVDLFNILPAQDLVDS